MLIWKEQFKYEIMMSLASCGTAVELGQRAGQWWHSPCQRAASPDTITRGSHVAASPTVERWVPRRCRSFQAPPPGSRFILWQFALMISLRSPRPRLPPGPHPGAFIPGSTRCNFPQFLLRCWPGVSGLLRFLVLTPHSLCQEAITVRVRCPRSYFAAYPFFRTVSETWDFFFFFTSRIDQDNTIQDHAWLSEHGLSVITWAWLRVERQWPLTAVSLLHFPANRLSPRLGGPAVPDVLAAHLHPGAPPAPAGLLLVSWPCRLPWAQTRTGRRRLICRWSKLRGLTHVCVWMRPLKPDMEISNKC